MPELPEVEVVRSGLDRWVSGRAIASVQVLHPRAVRRAADEFPAELCGMTIRCVTRRGKYLWMPLDSSIGGDGAPTALVSHLGMSGQLLMQPANAVDERHLRIRIGFDDDARELRFVDQRTFGGMYIDALTDDDDGGRIPVSIAHIARDPLDPKFDDREFSRRLRARSTEVKRALLDQSLVSGIGNIYADEALWRTRLHGARPTQGLSASRVAELLGHVRAVMGEALAAGGTSFDALYVNVNGQSGYFDRSLQAYGREGEPCPRCGRAIRRERFMNRSSFSCPACQRRPPGERR